MISREYNPEPLWVARRRMKLRQTDLARNLNMSRLTIVRAEAGSPLVTSEVLRSLCAYLSIPFESLSFTEKNLTEMSPTT